MVNYSTRKLLLLSHGTQPRGGKNRYSWQGLLRQSIVHAEAIHQPAIVEARSGALEFSA